MSGAICVDASVAVKWLLPEEGSEKALALLEAALSAQTDVIGPPHLPVEVTSAIHKRFRQRELTLAEAHERLRAFSRIPIDLTYPASLAERALELTTELDLPYPYDAFYLAVGEVLRCEVWTADERFYGDAHAGYPRLRLLST